MSLLLYPILFILSIAAIALCHSITDNRMDHLNRSQNPSSSGITSGTPPAPPAAPKAASCTAPAAPLARSASSSPSSYSSKPSKSAAKYSASIGVSGRASLKSCLPTRLPKAFCKSSRPNTSPSYRSRLVSSSLESILSAPSLASALNASSMSLLPIP